MTTTKSLLFIAGLLCTSLFAAEPGDSTRSLSDLKVTAHVDVTPKIIVGDATSSLSHARAVELAQTLAAYIPGAGVAVLDGSYTGKYSPAVPTNAVYVVEPADFSQLKPFDLVLFKDPSGALRIRTLLGRGSDKALVGFAFLDVDTQAEIAPQACVGRVVATIRFDPTIK